MSTLSGPVSPPRSTPPRPSPGPTARHAWGLWAMLAGVVSVAAGLVVAELVAAIFAPGASPFFAAGAGVVDQVPPWLKDWAVATFGTADKTVLITTMAVVIAIGAALAGVLELRRPPWGAMLVVVVGAVGGAVVVTRPGASGSWILPTIVGIIVAAMLLRSATERLRGWRDAATGAARSDGRPSPAAAAIDRRRFLALTGVTVLGAAIAGLGARVLASGAQAVSAAREALHLPAPARPAPAIPPGADLKIDGLAPYVTPSETFYRIDTALRVPQVDPATWTLKITGLVDEPFELTFDELLALPLVEHDLTLTCVSNKVGGDLIGNARWLGYPIRDLLARAKPQAGADMVLSTSVDGWTAGTPLDVLTDTGRECLLAVGMNGGPLPADHGFPARLVVPGLYGYVSATKWVAELKVSRFADDTAYWSDRGWSVRGPIKLASRIDTPRSGRTLDSGKVTVAGVAWAQHTGISAVEVKVDDEEWQPATLADTVSADTWRQWSFDWDTDAAGSGRHVLAVRATDADGTVQTAQEAPPVPDGASGWHLIEVTVR